MNLNGEYKAARLAAIDGLTVTDRTYNLIIGLVVLWGLLVNFLMCRLLAVQILSMNYLVVLIAYFAGSLAGMFIVYRSPSAAVSFLGFTLLAVAMGLLLTFFLSLYSAQSILLAIRVTGAVTCVMLILSLLWPHFFLSLGRTLLVALIACVVIQLVFGLLFRVSMGWMDWVVALIFCGYIGYDWAKAQLYPRTVDNAVDSAADIYVDIINLFVRVLSIVGRNDSRRN